MDNAVANSQAAPAETEAAKRAEIRLIAGSVSVLVLLGVLLQLAIAPGPVTTVVFTLLLTVTIVAVAYVVRGRLLDMLGGFRLAAVVLALLAFASAAGTMILQSKPPEFYRAQYGSVAWLISALRLDDLFHTFWFGALVALMNGGLLVSAARRWPVTPRNAGFFLVHLGILVSLAGAGVSSVFSVKGRIDLRVGEAASTVRVTRSGLSSAPEVALGGGVKLLKFDVDRYKDEPRISLYMPSKKKQGFDLKATFENEPGVVHRLPGKASFRIKAFYPELVMSERLTDGGDGTTPALELTVDGKAAFLMAPDKVRLDGAGATILFGWKRPEAKVDAPLHTLQPEKGDPVPVRVGETVTLADGTVAKVLRFFPHFTYDLATKVAVNVSPTAINPALEVEVGGTKRWLFANMPGFGHDKSGPKLSYAYAPEGGAASGTVIAVGGSDKTVLVKQPDGTEQTLALAPGLEVGTVRFGALREKAALVREPSSASENLKNPAVLLELTQDEKTREVLMTAAEQRPVEVGRGFLNFETRVDEVKAFRSEVELSEGPGATRRAIVAVNDPVPLAGWMLYQVNYDPKDPTYSGLEAVRDPGVAWVFVGFGMLFFGVVYVIYVSPRLRRKEA